MTPQLHLFKTPLRAPFNGFVSLCSRRRYTRFFSNASSQFYNGFPLDIKRRRFAERMQLAGLKPHHPIAMGVSGGADSMALCVLMVNWKSTANASAVDSSGFINGLLAIIVDHGLRPESTEEANTVSSWLTDMGIRSEIARCAWHNGLPKTSHFEEMARHMRYEIFQDVCFRHQIGVLLIAHHADDQAELFILRLSRNSGVLGLAGMAFTSQLFPKFPSFSDESSNNQGILVVRPLLDFTKEDLYEICEKNNQKWVEDPTNRSSLFARNRIRMSLQDMKSCTFRNELQELIALCRRTRLYVDHICQILLNQAVTVMPYGYVIIDLEKLNSSKIEDICLSRFLALVVQFVSQRHRPVRGSALKLLLDYTRTFPCKISLTAASCYLCAAPGSKGTKILVCCSVDSALPLNTDLYSRCPDQGTNQYIPSYVEQIIMEQRSQLKPVISDSSDAHFLEAVSSDSVLGEARKLKFISESSYETIKELQKDERNLFKAGVKSESSSKSKNEQQVSYINDLFQPGPRFYFMNRFFLIWTSRETEISCDNFSDDGEGTQNQICSICTARDTVAYIRHMIDEDWLYLAKLSKTDDESCKFKQKKFEQVTDKTSLCSEHRKLSAEQALKTLKSIPVAVRRSLPVIVRVEDGVLLNIPSIGFKHCSTLVISAQFRPRVPLGGGHSSFT